MLHFLVLFTFFFLPFDLKAQLSKTVDCEEIVLNADITPACEAGAYGEVILRISQGLPPYRVQWQDGSKQTERTVAEGIYQVTVTDALGCEVAGSFNVQQFPALHASAAVKNTSKAGKVNGSIQILVNGGSPPYHYSWMANNGRDLSAVDAATQHLTKLAAGIYKIVIFDAGGCYTELETEVK